MQSAKVRLIGVEIDRAQPLAGNTTAGDCLEIPSRRIHFDGFFLDELIALVRVPEMPDRFLTGEKYRLFQLAHD